MNVGPSALALGLLIPITKSVGFDVCIVARAGDKGPREFGIRSTGPTGRLRFVRVSWYEGPHRAQDLPRELLERLKGCEPVLITGSLRDRIGERRGLIEELLSLRPSGAETVVLACENTPHPEYEQIFRSCEQLDGAMALETVVNRMCIALGPDSANRRIVSAHPLGEWLVERPAGESTILAALEQSPHFSLVDNIAAHRDRKIWMVNGAHRALALMARRGNEDSRLRPLDITIHDQTGAQAPGGGQRASLETADDLRRAAFDPETAARLGQLHALMNEALRIKHPELPESGEYAVRHVVAYAEHHDSVARVLKDLRRLNLMPFLDSFDERISEPARICRENGLSVDPFIHVLDVLTELVANIDAFEDNVELRSKRISPELDARVVKRFGEAIAPWVGGDLEKRVAHFAQVLSDQRAALSR